MTDNTIQLRVLRELPGRLRATLAGLDDAQLDTPYREGGWTIRQVVHHLADSHAHAYLRMKMMVNEDHPTIKPYDQNVWATNHEAFHGEISASLDLLDGLHRRWADFLEHLPESAWSRSALHPERGEVTMTGMLDTYANHGEKHIEHIKGLRRARGWA
jgi:uncharacterized damage-inducible protein DinB